MGVKREKKKTGLKNLKQRQKIKDDHIACITGLDCGDTGGLQSQRLGV